MDAFEFCKEFGRMCKNYEYCDGCPLDKWERETNLSCRDVRLSDEHIQKRINIVEKWSKEHPKKTMMQDFFEKHPNAPKRRDGAPTPCPDQYGYGKQRYCVEVNREVKECRQCWSRPMEE